MPLNDDDSDDARDLAHELRSFGRRTGRGHSPRQQSLLTDVLPRVSLDITRALPATARPLWLEIGFGGGEHLVWQAEHNPHVDLIGCEPFIDGVVKVLTAIDTRHLDTIRIHTNDARDVLRWLPDASIERAFVLFPDPWPKKRHVKRRLVNRATLALLARVMKPGAELRLATDIKDYSRTMLAALARTPQFRWTARSPQDWRSRPAEWPPTRYEAKAIREGRQSVYLNFVRVADEP